MRAWGHKQWISILIAPFFWNEREYEIPTPTPFHFHRAECRMQNATFGTMMLHCCFSAERASTTTHAKTTTLAGRNRTSHLRRSISSIAASCGKWDSERGPRFVVQGPLLLPSQNRSNGIILGCSKRHWTQSSSGFYSHWKTISKRSSSSECRAVNFDHVKRGTGTVEATARAIGRPDNDNDPTTTTTYATSLSTLSHKAPVRLVPSTTLLMARTSSGCVGGAASCAVSHYGGGMAAGDCATLCVTVQPHAKLLLHTQGTNRIYKQSSQPPAVPSAPSDLELSSTATTEGNATFASSSSTTNSNSNDTKMTVSTLEATIESHALLVHAPDPVSLHADSCYSQTNVYTLQDTTSNLVAVDWIAAGRLHYHRQGSVGGGEGERWQHQYCSTRTTLRFLNSSAHVSSSFPNTSIPALVDSQIIPPDGDFFLQNNSTDSGALPPPQFNAIVTVYLVGPLVQAVVDRFVQMQQVLVSQYTSVRQQSTHEDEDDSIVDSSSSSKDSSTSVIRQLKELVMEELSGSRVLVGVSLADARSSSTPSEATGPIITTVRLAAATNEDIYRLLHFALRPLPLGTSCYRNRIHASKSSVVSSSSTTVVGKTPRVEAASHWKPKATLSYQHPLSWTSSSSSPSSSLPIGIVNWPAFMLADSALPIGSFAHSCGLEVASQLGLLGNARASGDDHEKGISMFVQTVVKSNMRLSFPLLICSSLLTKTVLDKTTEPERCMDKFLFDWTELDAFANALLVSNAPTYRASLDQGRNLMRVAMQLIKDRSRFLPPLERRYSKDTNPQHIIDGLHQETLLKILVSIQSEITGTAGRGHLSTVFGAVTRLLQVQEDDAAHLFGYCVARDVVSSAVRLNLLGPLVGQSMLLYSAHEAAHAGIAASMQDFSPLLLRDMDDSTAMIALAVQAASGCAPVLDAIHPCHDILATRLFRT